MIKINLAPPPARKRLGAGMPGLNLGGMFGILVLALAAGIGAYWWGLTAEATRLRTEIAEQEQEIQRLRVVIAEGQRYKRDKEELERRVAAIETVARNQTRATYLVDAAADMLPRDLWLTRMEEKGGQLRFAGIAHSTTAIADFMANLKASGRFKEVDLVESRQDLTKTPRTITFEVVCRFEV
jgi:type IV pilus assembly protein PilN